MTPVLTQDLINRYDKPGPRYTSYPPATEFHEFLSEVDFQNWAQASNEELIPKPLSLYFHIPFCSSVCYYCACNKIITKNKDKAEPYLHDLTHEIEICSRLFDADREVHQLHWGGGTPGFLSRQQSSQLMEKIGSCFCLRPGRESDYSIEIDPRVMVPGDIWHLKSIGFNRISIGVQDLEEQVQHAINRKQSLESTAAVVAEAHRAGFRSINFDLIYGLPHQTEAGFARTLEALIELRPDRFAIYNYAHLPHRFPPQRRIDADDLPDSNEKLAILNRTIEALSAAGYLYIGLDHFALPGDELVLAQRNGSLQRNFQGYSTHAHCDSIGFGVSAISRLSDNFSQNAYDLETYHRRLEQGRLPIVRGVESSPYDLLRRDVIQNLICHFYIDIRQIETKWNINFNACFEDELAQLYAMQADDLLEIDAKSIKVSSLGRMLVRNICMVFDSYQDKTETQASFSRTI